MAGRRPHHLERRKGVYYFRCAFPPDVREIVGRAELRQSLKTRDPARARAALIICEPTFTYLCQRLRTMRNAPETVIQNLVQDVWRRGQSRLVPPPAFDGPDGDEEFQLTEFWALERIAQLEHAVRTDDYSGSRDFELVPGLMAELRGQADELSDRYGPFQPGHRLALLQGLARVRIEEQKQQLHQLTDRVVPYVPSDRLFAPRSGGATFATDTASISFENAVAAYIRAKSGTVWTPRTEHENRKILGLASEHFGPLRKLDEITKDEVRSFKDGLTTWRIKAPAAMKLRDLVDAPEDKRISSITAAKYFGYITSAFGFWVEEGYLTASPVGKMTVKVPKGRRLKARESFSDDDLVKLFNSPMYRGCAGPQRRMTTGPHLIKDGYYWIPLVAALSGMRLTEIAQLVGNDVDVKAEVPAMQVRGDAKAGQKVKSEAGWRTVPIHRRLVELGFLDFIAKRQARGTSERIFYDVTPGGDHGGLGGEFSKWFGRRMSDIGLKRDGLVFHSFRHRFVQELREHGTPNYLIKTIIGHAGRDVTDGYGGKAGAKTCKPWIDNVSILDQLPEGLISAFPVASSRSRAS